MPGPLVECVPNFSEGRDPALLRALAETAGRDVAVLDQTADADHHRSVLTLAGPPEAMMDAVVRLARVAVGGIDLRDHAGAHPRIGALDVLPFVPLRGITLAECARLAAQAGQRLWDELGVPVYFYEAAACRPDRVRLEQIRQGGFEVLRAETLTDPVRQPDIGGPALHPTAGATVAGARPFLIAYNINLHSGDLTLARQIARQIRASSGGFPCVKALGLALPTRSQVQVSMNLTDYTVTPLARVFTAVQGAAQAAGVAIAGSELIGLIPQAALAGTETLDLRWENFRPDAVLETRLQTAGLE